MKSNLALFSHFYHGRINQAFRTSNEGLQIAEESGDIYSKAMAYVIHGYSCYGKGLLEEAEKYLLKGLEFCEKINFAVWDGAALIHLGDTYYDLSLIHI